MRRSDREIKDMDQIMRIVMEGTVCCVAFCDDPYPYVLPMNYGAAQENGKILLYFHGANEGKKLELIRKNPYVSFTILGEYEVRLDTVDPAGSTAGFESVCGAGTAEIVPVSERKRGLSVLMNQIGRSVAKTYTEQDFSDELAVQTTVWKISADELTGKKHK